MTVDKDRVPDRIEDERKRVQAAQLDAKVEKQVHQLAESFNVNIDSLEGVRHAHLHADSCQCALHEAYQTTSVGTASTELT
jgi:enoyl-[acyl-carrier-protein] reductase (NADH)